MLGTLCYLLVHNSKQSCELYAENHVSREVVIYYVNHNISNFRGVKLRQTSQSILFCKIYDRSIFSLYWTRELVWDNIILFKSLTGVESTYGIHFFRTNNGRSVHCSWTSQRSQTVTSINNSHTEQMKDKKLLRLSWCSIHVCIYVCKLRGRFTCFCRHKHDCDDAHGMQTHIIFW